MRCAAAGLRSDAIHGNIKTRSCTGAPVHPQSHQLHHADSSRLDAAKPERDTPSPPSLGEKASNHRMDSWCLACFRLGTAAGLWPTQKTMRGGGRSCTQAPSKPQASNKNSQSRPRKKVFLPITASPARSRPLQPQPNKLLHLKPQKR